LRGATSSSEIDVLEEWLGLGRPALKRSLPWLGATLALGALFLAGQWTAWRQLMAQGFAFNRFATPASYFFYLITGLHAVHLLLGVAALTICLSALGWLRRVEYRQIAVDATAWYWHAMGLGLAAAAGRAGPGTIGDNADNERRARDGRVDHCQRDANRKRIQTGSHGKNDQFPAACRIDFAAFFLFAAKGVAHNVSAHQSQQRKGHPSVEPVQQTCNGTAQTPSASKH
jgi:hypothetical protein